MKARPPRGSALTRAPRHAITSLGTRPPYVTSPLAWIYHRARRKLGADALYIKAIIEKMTDRSAELDQLNEVELENVRIALAKQVARESLPVVTI